MRNNKLMALNMKFKQHTIIITTALLSSCVSFHTTSQASYNTLSWQQRQASLKTFTHWHINGALSITNNGHTDLASYTWQQQSLQQFNIVISGPLDIGTVTVASEPGRVTLLRGNKAPITAATADQLMLKALGWHLPVSRLQYWIRGLPASANAKLSFDRYHHLTRLKNQGWQVAFSHYITVSDRDLPQTLTFQHGQQLFGKLVMRWR